MQSIFCFVFLFSELMLAATFSFTTGTATECDDLSIKWTGGTAPFQFLIIPQFGTPRNISIPSSAFQDGKGTYSTKMTVPSGHKVILTMSDASGFGSGGNTGLLTVGSSLGGSCNTTNPAIDFEFQLNTALQQCRPYVFSGYDHAIQPVTIMGIIPAGESFVLNPPVGPTSYSWTVNIYNGTSLIFVMVDSHGRQGGSSDLYTIGASDDVSCINKDSPSSTASQSQTGTPSGSTSSPTSTASNGTPIGAIAGTVLGALIFLAVSVTMGLFFLKKRRDKKWSPGGFRRDSYRIRSQTNLNLTDMESPGPTSPYHYSSPLSQSGNSPSYPFFSPFPQSESGASLSDAAYLSPVPQQAATTRSNVDPFSPLEASSVSDPFNRTSSSQTPTTSSSAAQRKAAIAGEMAYKPSRFILHTDLEDAGPTEAGEEIVELPPQYTERRNQSSSSSVPSSTQFSSPDLYHPPS